MYEEQKIKLKKYKDMLKQSFIKQGMIANKKEIDAALEDVDLRYCILEQKTIDKNTVFDTEEINRELYMLYQDLTVLYEYLYNIELKKYIELESYVNGYLSSLEEMANRCEQKGITDTSHTSLGNTILFQSSGFDTEFKEGNAIITLDGVSLEPESEISCFIEGTGFEQSATFFAFIKKNKIEKMTTPYSAYNNTMKADGKIKTNIYPITLDSSAIGRNYIRLTLDKEISSKYNYYGLSGKNKIKITQLDNSSATSIETKENAIESIETKENAIEKAYFSRVIYHFFLKNASYIKFDFSRDPIDRNFAESEATVLPELAEIRFTMPRGGIFDFETDGVIYAEKVDISQVKDTLYISSLIHSTDLYLIENVPGQADVYDSIKVTMQDIDPSVFKVNSIAIKELSMINKYK